jgi:uncharacterized protein (TIGR03435 family)
MRFFLALSALALCALAQQATNPAMFEVADVKPSNPAAGIPGKARILPGGRIELYGATAKNLIMFAYGVQENMIVGATKWAETEHFDVVAKAPEGTPPAMIRTMLQSLLADRLKLALHREDRPGQAYVLSRGKRPLELLPGDGGKPECGWHSIDGGLMRRECKNLPMDEFVRQMPGLGGVGIDRQVLDETGLKGGYTFHFDVGAVRSEREGGAPGAVADASPNIFEALDRIGLKLESRKMPVSVIIIDRIEHPDAN